jgi:UDP-4-amino-4,6-dideoxy-N-acetyl-beta-L-altrosamine N-acetyltransferase
MDASPRKKLGNFRDVQSDDLPEILSWRNSPEVRKFMYTRSEIALKDHLVWWNKISQNPKYIYLIYEYEGVPMGVVSFSHIDFVNKNCSWAFYAAPKAIFGVGPRMEFLAIEFAFSTLRMHKLYCQVLDFNVAVVNLHQKFGFLMEGVLKKHHLYDGRFIDIIQLGLISKKFRLG